MKINKLLLLLIPVVLSGCSKSGGSTTTPTVTPPPVVKIAEADIAFKIEIDNKEIDYAAIYAALGATQAMNINVNSTPFPKDGVTIDVNIKKDSDNTILGTPTSTVSSTASTNASSISSLSQGVVCNVTVTVTSKTMDPVSSTYKSLSKIFKISRK